MRRLLLLAIIVATGHHAAAQPTTWQWNDLNSVSATVHDKAMSLNQGIVGMDALFPRIAGFVGSTVSVEAIGRRTTHFAIQQTKRAHTGILTEFYRNSGGFMDDDDDVLMYIHPNPGDKPFEDYVATGRTRARQVEGEIDVKDAFAASVLRLGPKLFSQFTGFGPFVHENHNFFDTRPHDVLEIHPSENIWWSELAGGKLKSTNRHL